jgi:hypothetical protein
MGGSLVRPLMSTRPRPLGTYQGEMAHIVMHDCTGAVMRSVLGEVCYPLELGCTGGLTRVHRSRLARVTNLSR